MSYKVIIIKECATLDEAQAFADRVTETGDIDVRINPNEGTGTEV